MCIAKATDDMLMLVWTQFTESVPTEKEAKQFLFRAALADHAGCPCGKCEALYKAGDRFFSWNKCKEKVWFTSGTLFHGASKLRAWLASVWFKQQGVLVSASMLARLCGIASSTAQAIQRKVNLVLVEKMDLKIAQVPVKKFAPVIIKRSLDTPANLHPSEEKYEDPIAVRAKKYTRKLRTKTQITIGVMRKYFHGVSRKYLQLYLAALWCFFNSASWRNNALLIACLKHSPISYEQTLQYCSPSWVKL